MPRTRRLTAVASALVLLVAGATRAQVEQPHLWEDLHWEPLYLELKHDSRYSNYTRDDFFAARSRSGQILAEIDGAADEWAGEYGSGGSEVGFTTLRLAPESGFVLVYVYTCLPSVRWLNYGRVVAKPHVIELVPSLSLHDLWRSERPVRFLKVKWGEWRYLIPEKQIGSFCDYVAGLGAFNGEAESDLVGSFFVKRGDHADPADELPVVPPGYEHFVKRSVDATIVDVGVARVQESDNPWWNDLVTPVTIDAGRMHGVRPGMVFYLYGSTRGETVEVRTVGARTAKGVIVRSTHKPGVKIGASDDGKDPDYEPIHVGWRMSTSQHKWLASCRDDEGSGS
jgi:hypothetical protein